MDNSDVFDKLQVEMNNFEVFDNFEILKKMCYIASLVYNKYNNALDFVIHLLCYELNPGFVENQYFIFLFLSENIYLKAVKSNIYKEIELPTANQYDKNKNPDIDNYPNVGRDLINNFIRFCRSEQSFKTVSDDPGSSDYDPRYHLIVNDVKNDKVIRAITE
ncbi:hypothetical protein BCR36DRAFT_411490 [Piromyces finnis]|uniref:Uncharacterized protein n=1 Tax=Piromyces finnis TaxID=1754191 RepID=A0A1Y1VCI9_9FUNG|nr:hypothetical protein BCR36DRAFT_411490 [Piromyces finnis]|eukprot:ORX52605.1 hypothetical protein BCR36DRAFT_411490 [Piromyces finnis]